jgi:MFS family permease
MQTSIAIDSHDDVTGSGALKWVFVAALFFVSALNYADRTSITAVFPLLKSQFGFTDVGLGAIGSMFLWSYAVASPLAGYVGDRFDRSRIIVWSLGIWSLATLLTGLVQSQAQLLATRVALGLVEAMYLPAAYAFVTEHHTERTRATALTLVSVGNFVGLVAGGSLGGYLGAQFGWRVPLIALGVAGVVTAFAISFLLPKSKAKPVSPQSERESFIRTVGQLARIPTFYVLAIAGMLGAVGIWIFINWLPLYFHETFGMTLAAAGFWGSSVVSTASAISAAAGGPISDFIARRNVGYRMLLNAALVLCAAPALLVFVYVPAQPAVIAALLAYAIFRSIGDLNIVPLLCHIAGERRRSTAVGLTNMLNTGTAGIGVFVAGMLKRDFGLGGVFVGVGAILLVDALLLFVGYFLFFDRNASRRGIIAESSQNHS